MTTAQWLYVILLAAYAILFLSFSRLFYWRHYAQKHYYDKKPLGLSEAMIAHMAYEKGHEVPRFSIFVPARNEADVIEKTIDHMTRLRYAPERYEILVVTDEKEVQAAIAERAQLCTSLLPVLAGKAPFLGGEAKDAVLRALLSRLAPEEAPSATALATHVIHQAAKVPAEQLAGLLASACAEAYPTTQEIVERKRLEFADRPNLPRLKHVIVPWDVDGHVGGVCTGELIPSTKGRALNYAFRFADPTNELWAFYDAESRPDRDILLYVAWRRLTVGEQFQLAQGPVYQVRNFWKLGPICKIAGLYQGISHEWQIPWLLRSIPLIGGTNFYSTRELMLRIGGIDHTVLSEDMELGVRAWLKGDAWPEFVPYSSSEQTPATLRAFFRQRLRWGSGYLQVYDKLKADTSLPAEKRNKLLRFYWWRGHFSWTLFQLVTFLPIIVLILALNQMIDPSGVPPIVNRLPLLFSPIYFCFTFYAFFHYYKYMDGTSLPRRIFGFSQILAMPFAAFFLPVPYSSALVLKWIGRAPKGWVKTPRTKE